MILVRISRRDRQFNVAISVNNVGALHVRWHRNSGVPSQARRRVSSNQPVCGWKMQIQFIANFHRAHVPDGEVEEEEDELDADAGEALELAHDGVRVGQRRRQVLAVLEDLDHRVPHVLQRYLRTHCSS